ncbi:hypothetical protein BgAZ_110990 [Babesia gibsoni]|uniref:Nucleoplasmin-like domain-containing protein n=1 Tax=Babesia gibsoni TaxID=33632 RepID=A0AAD8PGR4_BABGI|nr:hypothetical protein BgAZ_110990 [Babesia gibsoni]
MFFGAVIPAGGNFEANPEEASVVHVSQFCLNEAKDGEKTYVMMVDGKTAFNVCVLQKDVCEHATVDLYYSTDSGIKLATKGGKNEVHVLGYYENEGEGYLSDSDDEEIDEEDADYDDDEGDDEPEDEPAQKKKNTGKGK